MLPVIKKPFLQEIRDGLVDRAGISLSMLRLDVIHHTISGNKWYKLKYNLKEAVNEGFQKLLTFGGAYSNHVMAVAEAANLLNLDSVGVIRGEPTKTLNPTLFAAESLGMELHFVSRESYRNKGEESFQKSLRDRFGRFYLLPEGGTNSLAIKGAKEIAKLIGPDFDHIVLPVGTGGTATGICLDRVDSRVWGISALKGIKWPNEIEALGQRYDLPLFPNLTILVDYHFGGYAKFNDLLVQFINDFKLDHDIPLEPIYTGKMMFGVMDMISKGLLEKGSRVVAINTGGLQGIAGFNARFGKKIL